MKNFMEMILENRKNTTALKKDQVELCNISFKTWKEVVESLRFVTSNYAVLNRENNTTDDTINDAIESVYTEYKKVLSFFTNKSLGEKVKAQASDLNSLLTMVGTFKKDKYGAEGKQFMPQGATVFRGLIEDFIADRISENKAKTAEEVEAERKARREAKKAAKKAKEETKAKEEAKAKEDNDMSKLKKRTTKGKKTDKKASSKDKTTDNSVLEPRNTDKDTSMNESTNKEEPKVA